MDTRPADREAAQDSQLGECVPLRNDDTLERIYIGRRFKNDTERLEKLFELYTEMVGRHSVAKKRGGRK